MIDLCICPFRFSRLWRQSTRQTPMSNYSEVAETVCSQSQTMNFHLKMSHRSILISRISYEENFAALETLHEVGRQ